MQPLDASDARSFGESLRAYRVAAGLSQEQLAERARMSVWAVSALERGTRRAPYRQTIALLATALGLDASQREALESFVGRSRSRGRDHAAQRSSAPSANNLPSYLTSYVAREHETEQLMSLLRQQRLVTVIGLGGIGKTRLACEVARQLAVADFERILFVDMSMPLEASQLSARLAVAAGLNVSSEADALDLLESYLRSAPTLYVLDSCEVHAAAVASGIAAVLKRCRDMTILATSRERLGVAGECLFRLDPLKVPEPGLRVRLSTLRTWPAVALFIDRATTTDPQFVATERQTGEIVEVCRRLDGLPLAIELAAARLPTLGLGQLHRQLTRVLAAPGANRDAPARQQTMEATISWSSELLEPAARALLEALGVFAGGFSLEAVQSVCASDDVPESSIPDLLESLVEKSLVQAKDVAVGRRYALLEPVRLFCLERLEPNGRRERLFHRHAVWLADLADRINASIVPGSVNSSFASMSAESDNVRAALERLYPPLHDDDRLILGRIVGGFRSLWIDSRWTSEGNAWAARALAAIDTERTPAVAASVYRLFVQTARGEGPLVAASEQAKAFFERVGDHAALGALLLHVVHNLVEYGALSRARTFIDEFEQRYGAQGLDERFEAWFFRERALLHAMEDRPANALADNARSIEIAERLQDPGILLLAFSNAAWVEARIGNLEAALANSLYAINIQDSEPGLAMKTYVNQALVAECQLVLGRYELAYRHARQSLSSFAAGAESDGSFGLQVLAVIATQNGDVESAALLQGFAADALSRYGVFVRPLERRIGEMLDREIRRRASAAQVDAWRAAGRRLHRDDARELALSVTGPGTEQKQSPP